MGNFAFRLVAGNSSSVPRKEFTSSVWRRRTASGLVVACLFVVSPAHAAPVVIYDSGQTVPISQFLSPAFENSNANEGTPMRPVAPDASRVPIPVTFPVRTANMRPGKLQAPPNAVKLPSWLPTGVFLIGTDEVSKEWIVRNREVLAKQRAAGIVVHADNLDAFRSIQALGRGLPMAPSSAKELSQRLRLSVYPVLIRPDGVIVQ